MNDLFGGHHTSGSPAKVARSALRVPFPPVSDCHPATGENESDASKNRGSEARGAWYLQLVRPTMPQRAIAELIEDGRDLKTALRMALELAAQEIEKQSGNPMYAAAFKKSAARVRALKPD